MVNKIDMMTLGASFGIPKDDVFLIIQSIMNISSKDLFLLSDIDEEYIALIKSAFLKRHDEVPLEHILGETEFYGNRFFVNEYTLIPKNDTEILVEKTIEYIKQLASSISLNPTHPLTPSLFKRGGMKPTTLIDVGTGTGCIPISILNQIGENIFKTYAIDISSEALDVAKQNISLHKLSDKIEVLQGDLFSLLESKEFNHLVVTANLPYIPNDDFENIDQQVIDHEPHTALFGGEKTGFELYEKLVNQLQSVKAQSIMLFIEIGFDQGDIVRDFCKKHKIYFEIYRDNGGVERCVEMKII